MALAPDFEPVDLQQADIDSYAGLFGDLNADDILLCLLYTSDAADE